MRLAIHDFGGYGFSAQLARSLALRGHEVLYLRARDFRPDRHGTEPASGQPSALQSEEVGIGRRASQTPGFARLLDERRYGRELARRVIHFKPDVVLSANCPLDAQLHLQASVQAAGAGFVFWLQDIHSAAIGRILGRRVPVVGRLIGSRFARLERRILQASDAVVCITEDFVPALERWAVASDRIHVVKNWAPLDEVGPRERVNAWSVENGLRSGPVFLYAGTLGRKHDPALLLDLAEGIPTAQVIVVAEGAGAEWLREHADRPTNLRLLPYQPASSLSEVLASADVLVALLAADAGTFSVPSKVLTYLAASRPILAAMPATNLAARTIVVAGAGRVVSPSDAPGFVRAAKELIADAGYRARAAAAGLDYATRTFDIDPITEAFEGILRSAVRPAPSRLADASDTATARSDSE